MNAEKVRANNAMSARRIFASALRKQRMTLGLSQEVLADRADVHRTYVGQIERAEKNVSIDSMEKLAKAVDLPLWMLLRPEALLQETLLKK